MVTKIQNNDMSSILSKNFAVVDFSAQWCGPCKMLAPIMDELSESYPDGTFFNIDSDENMELAVKYQIQSIPALLFFKNGQVVGQSVGFMPKPQLQELVEKYHG